MLFFSRPACTSWDKDIHVHQHDQAPTILSFIKHNLNYNIYHVWKHYHLLINIYKMMLFVDASVNWAKSVTGTACISNGIFTLSNSVHTGPQIQYRLASVGFGGAAFSSVLPSSGFLLLIWLLVIDHPACSDSISCLLAALITVCLANGRPSQLTLSPPRTRCGLLSNSAHFVLSAAAQRMSLVRWHGSGCYGNCFRIRSCWFDDAHGYAVN